MKGALIPVLHEVQEFYGYLPMEVQKVISEELNISLSEIYGVVTFYSQFSLTKKGETIVDKDNSAELFKLIIDSFFNKWNWAYGDGYSELQLIQSSVVFNLYLLYKKVNDWVLGEDLGRVYLDAFPALVNEVTDSYFGPEKEIINCFNTRFLDRVCLPLGILESKEEGKGFDRQVFYKVSDLFQNIFSFDNKS